MTYDAQGVEDAISALLAAIGEDPDRDGLLETPSRVARSLQEIFAGLEEEDPAQHLQKTFEVETSDLVLVKDIDFHSMCEHHLLPFRGKVHVAYLPTGNRVTGLSKLARCVDGYAARPQIQERLTAQIANAIEDVLEARGVAVVVEAEHMCMSLRGVRKHNPLTVTTQFRGDLAEPAQKQEVLDLIRN